jgi:pimeloyl-ACP methyl ester carboxylesterase
VRTSFEHLGLGGFVLRELGAYVRQGALGVTSRRHRPSGSADGSSGPWVLFIHGHGGSGAAFRDLERALAEATPNLRFAAWDYSSRGHVADLARRLADWAAGSAGELHVVAHSLGGILARVWLQELGGRARVRSLTTLSTPHQGLARFWGAGFVPIVRELGVGSPLLARLEASVGTLSDLPCLSVVSTRDHFIRPWQRAAFGNARLAPVDDVGHVGVLYSPAVHALVVGHVATSRGA